MSDELPAEARALLDRLSDWVKTQGQQQTDRAAPWAWVTGLIIAAIAMLAVGFMYWRSWRQGRELAEALHERDLARENAVKTELDSRQTATNAEVSRRRAAAVEAAFRALEANRAVKQVAARVVKTRENIHALQNWRDIDRYLAERGNGGGTANPPASGKPDRSGKAN